MAKNMPTREEDRIIRFYVLTKLKERRTQLGAAIVLDCLSDPQDEGAIDVVRLLMNCHGIEEATQGPEEIAADLYRDDVNNERYSDDDIVGASWRDDDEDEDIDSGDDEDEDEDEDDSLDEDDEDEDDEDGEPLGSVREWNEGYAEGYKEAKRLYA